MSVIIRHIQQQSTGIERVVQQLLSSSLHTKGVRGIRALQLFHMSLMRTQKELEDIYFHYILKPSIRCETTKEALVLPCVCICAAMLMTREPLRL